MRGWLRSPSQWSVNKFVQYSPQGSYPRLSCAFEPRVPAIPRVWRPMVLPKVCRRAPNTHQRCVDMGLSVSLGPRHTIHDHPQKFTVSRIQCRSFNLWPGCRGPFANTESLERKVRHIHDCSPAALARAFKCRHQVHYCQTPRNWCTRQAARHWHQRHTYLNHTAQLLRRLLTGIFGPICTPLCSRRDAYTHKRCRM